jgi:autotransporter-associated beta strand protein
MRTTLDTREGTRGSASLYRAGHLTIFLLVLVMLDTAHGGSATWNVFPPTNDWNTATNWTPNTVPNSPDDTATFDNTSVPDVVIHSDVEVNGIVFTAQANSYTITAGDASTGNVVGFTISGLGIVNKAPSPRFQTIEAAPTLATNGTRNTIRLRNNAELAEATSLHAEGGSGLGSVGGQVRLLDNSTVGPAAALAISGQNGGGGGEIWFLDNSSASKKGGPSNGDVEAFGSGGAGSTPGQIFFKGTSTASNAYVEASGAAAAGGVEGGKIFFLESSNAGDGVVAALSGAGSIPDSIGGSIIFSDTASAGSAELVAYGSTISGGGTLQFLGDSSGGTTQVQLYLADNATLDISGHNPPGVTIGSLDGLHGTVSLGANTLTVGTNNLNTSYTGSIEGSGSLTKIGTGTLTLKGSNAYAGGTTVNGGVLNVANRTGSATGTGPVNVRTGTLAGDGIIAGNVTFGRRASLGPNDHSSNNLTIQGTLSFLAASAYSWRVDLRNVTADQVLANGVTISSGARFKPIAAGGGTLAIGTTFVVISNTSVNPISGTFENLPDGSIIIVQGNNLQANYEGGDGNDLVLTVVSQL